jgi:Pyruvate/2-oxoglutarate dehydrogenase complex, dehydrogenase (E1) component, eukaryotic type, alpha subunit
MNGLNKDQALHHLRQMLLIRRFEEKSAELYSAMKIRGFLHLYIGKEAEAVGVMAALSPEDAVVATYREHGQGPGARHERERDHGRDVWQGRGLLPGAGRFDASL